MSSTESPRARLLNSRTKQILFIVGAFVAVLAAVLAVYAILVTPSKQPYRDALAQYRNVYDANVIVMVRGTSLNASSATNEQFTKSTEAVTAALKALEIENEALGKAAVLQDGEGKGQYDAFTKKVSSYIAFNNDMLASMQQVRPVIYECSGSMQRIEEGAIGADAMQKCSANLAALSTVPNQNYQELVAASQSLYAALAANLQAKADLADPDGADADRAKSLDDEQEQILKDLNSASATFSTNLNKRKQAVDITNAAMTLDAYLSKKSSIF